MEDIYNVYSRTEYHPLIESNSPHTHNYHEIFMLLDGSVDFFVEGTKFPLKSGDTVIISAGDPHTKIVINKKIYKCFVIYLKDEFFKINNCPEYKKIFTTHLCTEHKINADTAERSEFYGAYQRLRDYTCNFTKIKSAITISVLTEMLHILNNNSEFSSNYTANPQIQRILEYINKNYTSKITLDSISNELFISKYYICKIFKKYTGYTINSYITNKRITQTEFLIRSGLSITEACIEAGFSDYSSFYRAFTGKYGKSPKKSFY